MHDALFRALFQEGRDISSLAVLLQIGASVGLEPAALRFALETHRYRTKVLEDEALAHDIGITGVPAIVLSWPGDGLDIECILSGAQPYELVQKVVERLLGDSNNNNNFG